MRVQDVGCVKEGAGSSAEEWRARAKEDGCGFEDGVAEVRRTERGSRCGLSYAASRLQLVARVQESQAGAG